MQQFLLINFKDRENDGFEITYFFKPNFRESEKKREKIKVNLKNN